MSAWQERVIAERDELNTRIEKLAVMLATAPPLVRGSPQFPLLERQLPCMRKYSEILGQRIALFVP